MFALVDCNNFYVSCERVFNPGLSNKPVCVLSNNDGCIISRSEEAKALGIKMGVPAFRIKEFLVKNRVTLFSANFALYGDLSSRVMNILASFTPNLEVYSIDEAFLDLKLIFTDELPAFASKMLRAVHKGTGIPVTIGIAPTKVLAKAANNIAKKNKSLGGIFIIKDKTDREKALSALNISDVWGIGRAYSEKLRKIGINSALDFTKLSDDWIRKRMTIAGIRIKMELIGEACLSIETVSQRKKAICTARSFGKTINCLEKLEEAITTYTSRCAEKLRRDKSFASAIIVFLHTNSFKAEEPQYMQNCLVSIPVSTADSIELVKFSLLGLKKIYKEGYNYKKAGVILTGITTASEIQGSLFDKLDRNRRESLMNTLDTVNQSFGRDALKIASSGTHISWGLRQEKLSPSYTTKWDEIILIKV